MLYSTCILVPGSIPLVSSVTNVAPSTHYEGVPSQCNVYNAVYIGKCVFGLEPGVHAVNAT